MIIGMKREDESLILAKKRTNLAFERTILAYLRTAASLFLFSIAFFGFKEFSSIFLYGGVVGSGTGVIFLIIALERFLKHRNNP